MPNLKDIQRRISSVKKTQQITRAMRMVAGAKLRRAQNTIEAARPYAQRMRATLDEVARSQKDAEHPLLAVREEIRNVEFVVVTSDRGLCGAFNANVLKLVEPLIRERLAAGAGVTVTTAGRKGRDYFKRHRPNELGGNYPQEGWVQYSQAVEIATRVSERYEGGEVDEVVLVYSEFVTTMTQRPRQVRLLPFATGAEEGGEEALPFEIEPSPEGLLKILVPRAVEVEIYRALRQASGESGGRIGENGG